MRDRIRRIVFRFGSQPDKSWAHFKVGLLVFAAGAALIIFGPRLSIYLQVPGIILVGIGFIIAMRGYLGIFANRFSQFLDKNNHRKHTKL